MRPSDMGSDSIETLEKYILVHGTTVLSVSERPQLQSLVAGSGVQYLVMDAESHPLYGTLSQTTVATRTDMMRNLNVTTVQHQDFIFGGTATRLIPVLGKNGSVQGAVYVVWDLYPDGKYGSIPLSVGFFVVLLCPFFYMALFTYIFARRTGRKINEPLKMLIEATRRIQERDLDFSIHYEGTNEIGQVVEAFEDMRSDLKESLLTQWNLEEERREMLAAISHDVRTPITIIQGHVENLLENPAQKMDKFHRYLETIARNTYRIARLMDDFRTVTEIDSHGFTLNPVETNIQKYIETKYHEFLIVTRSHGISLFLDYKDTRLMQSPMFIDVDRISQVIDNLMANAIRFTPINGQISWIVRVNDKRLDIEIEDSGQGFPTDATENLFKKFYQADKSRSGGKGHSGLGLYIVKALVEKHGGTVAAKNNRLGGATLQFQITSLDNAKNNTDVT